MKNFSRFLFVVLMLALLCNCTRPYLVNIQVCSETNELNLCEMEEGIVEFDSETPQIFITANGNYLPRDLVVILQWYQGKTLLKRQEIEVGKVKKDMDGGRYKLKEVLKKPDGGWKKGDYLVSIRTNYKVVKPMKKLFVIR